MTEVGRLASAPAFASTAPKISPGGDITMGLLVLILGLILFLGPHVFVTMREPRADVVYSYEGPATAAS